MKTALPLRRDVFILLQSFRPGGAERILAQLAGQLCDEVPVHVFVVRNVGPLANIIPASVDIVELGGRIIWLPRLLRYLWRLQPSSLLTSTWDLNLALLLLRRLIPRETRLIVREAVDPADAGHEKLSRRLLAPIYRRRCKLADAVVVLSKSLARRLHVATGIDPAKIYIIRNVPSPERCGEATALTHPDPGGRPVRLLAAGRLCEQKGFDVLLKALAAVAPEHPGAMLTIAGDGPELSSLRNLARQLHLEDRVTFPGHLENLRWQYENADLFILSSRYEGVSNVMIEALCSGVPVVATNKNTSADEFITDGMDGVLVTSCDVEHLRHGINRAIEMLPLFDRSAIASQARRSLSLEAWRKAYLELLAP